MISVIIINYNSSISMLNDCVEAYLRQERIGPEIIIYDNNSKNVKDLRAYDADLKNRYPQKTIKFLYSSKNRGFAKAVNAGIEKAAYGLVFISNFDIIVKEDALKKALEALNKHQNDNCAGIASKVYFMHDKGLIDNVGTGIDSNAGAFNRGVGLYDLGQYDCDERVFGVCFGACLLRKELFSPDKVGLLDEKYFMYYEDVDWCYRANALGYRFYSAPSSIVYHYHSHSVKHLDYGFKFKLIERNLLFTAIKNLENRYMSKVIIKRALSHIGYFFSGKFKKEIISIYFNLLIRVPCLIRDRFRMRRRRVIDDNSIFMLSCHEGPFFSPMDYTPIMSVNALSFIYKRIYVLTGDEKYRNKVFDLEQICESNLQYNREIVYNRLCKVLEGEPELALKYLQVFKNE